MIINSTNGSVNGTGYEQPRLLDPYGRPLPRFMLPHVETFQSIFQGGERPHHTYRWSFDEALRSSPETSLSMRRDAFIMGCLRERQRPVASMPWHIEPEDKEDPAQAHVAEQLTKLIEGIPNLRRLRKNLTEAIWFGRYAVQLKWEWEYKHGRLWLNVKDHQPLNGDKIGYTHAGCPFVRIYGPAAQDLEQKNARVITTDYNYGLLLDQPYWRERFIIHKHEIEDADYRESEMAGGIHGVGVRHFVYWMNWLRQEVMQWLLDASEKQGTGVWIFPYEAGNVESENRAREAAENQSRTNIVTWPMKIGTEKDVLPQFISVAAAGLEFLMGVVSDYFEGHIRRFIVGQELSSKASNVGLGAGSGQAEFQQQTKQEITEDDCNNLDETLSQDLVGPLMRHNFPEADFKCKWVSDVDEPDTESALAAAKTVFDMGVPMDANQVRGMAGLDTPKEGAETIQNQQQAHLGALAAMGVQGLSGGEGGAHDVDNLTGERVTGGTNAPGQKPDKMARTGERELYFDPNEPRDEAGKWTTGNLHTAHGKEIVTADGRILAVTQHPTGQWSIGRQHNLDPFSAADVLNQAGATLPPEFFDPAEGGLAQSQANPLALRPKKPSGKTAETLDFSQRPQRQAGLFNRDGTSYHYDAKGKEDDGGTWITIGGEPGENGEHEGGQPIKIDGSGRILAGPAGIAAKGIKSLSDFGGGGHTPATAMQPKKPHEMSLEEFEQHLVDTGQRPMYGPGPHGVKVAHEHEQRIAARKMAKSSPTPTEPQKKAAAQEVEKPKSFKEDQDAKAAEAGIDPNALHGQAKAILDAENEYRSQLTKMMHDARQRYADAQARSGRLTGVTKGPKTLSRSMAAFKGGDLGQIPGFDELTQNLMSEHPGLLGAMGEQGDTADAQQRLYDLLSEGTPSPMTKEEAYKKAWQILEREKEAQPEKAVPFARTREGYRDAWIYQRLADRH